MEAQEHHVCLLLGSNIQPERNLPRGVAELQRHLRVFRVSSAWQSAAVGSPGPDFLNCALLASTPLSADVLKTEVLRPLEAQLGRIRSTDKNAPRTIDIDIILFDGALLEPALWERAHVAVPVAELLPDYLSDRRETLIDAALRLWRTTRMAQRDDVTVLLDTLATPQVTAGPAGARDE